MLCARAYQPRQFDQVLLHQCVAGHWPRVRQACEAHGRPLPAFVQRDVTRPLRGPRPSGFASGKVALRYCYGLDAYLRCGDSREGFLRIHCAGCGHDRLVPFSCKGRGFCPSCGGRRMEEGAAWLCERVLPPVPLRQWVLSLPKVLRYLLAYDGKLCRAVAKTAMQEVFRYQRLRARRALGLGSTRQAHTGAMVAVQRFGSALNLNIHFHALVLDGVFVVDAFGHPAFMELAPPTMEDLHRVAARIAAAVLALLRHRHIWLDDLDEAEDPVAQRSESLAGMAKASISGTLVFGSSGAKPVRLQDARVWVPEQVERAGKALGFVLDAEVRVSADNRFYRERLCRYLLRPPLAKGRLHETMDGKYAFELKTTWPDGTRIIFFSGEELVARLTALVPPPRMHLVHYFGVLAPNARLRKQVVPEAPEDPEIDPCGHSVAYAETRNGRTIRRRWVPWAQLLLKVFSVDVLVCPKCDSRMQRIAVIQQPKVIAAILDCLSRKENPP